MFVNKQSLVFNKYIAWRYVDFTFDKMTSFNSALCGNWKLNMIFARKYLGFIGILIFVRLHRMHSSSLFLKISIKVCDIPFLTRSLM